MYLLNKRRRILTILLLASMIGLLNQIPTLNASSSATVKIGGSPWGVAYDSEMKRFYVVDTAAGMVSVFSDSDFSHIASVSVGRQPYRDIYDYGRGEIFVANYGDNTVSVISDATNTVVATIAVGIQPSSFAYDPVMGEIFVANSGTNTVSVISDATNSVVATITVGSNPYDLAYDSAKGEVFVANTYSRSVSVISDLSNQVIATIPVGSGPLGVVYDPLRSEVFVANSVSNTVSVISDATNSVIATISSGSGPGPMVYNAKNGQIYVVNRSAGTVSIISNSSNVVVETLNVGSKPYAATYDPSRGSVLVTNLGDGTISVISDTATIIEQLPLAQQIWVPETKNAVVAVGISAIIVGFSSTIFSTIDKPLEGVGGEADEKTRDIIPDSVRQWFEEVVSSRRETEAPDRSGSVLTPTRAELLAYATSVGLLAFSFAYVKVISIGQLWELLPFFLVTGVLVGFVQKFFSIVYLRSKGVWSEHVLWPLGTVLFLFTTVVFRVPFSTPTRSIHSKKLTEKHGALSSSFEILISVLFAGIFFLLMRIGYVEIGDAGLSMCILGSFFGTFPISPLSGKDIYSYSRKIWAALFLVTFAIFAAWLILL
jgi:YVTN family beta-propeller protein